MKQLTEWLDLTFMFTAIVYFIFVDLFLLATFGVVVVLLKLKSKIEYNKAKKEMLSMLMRAFSPK